MKRFLKFIRYWSEEVMTAFLLCTLSMALGLNLYYATQGCCLLLAVCASIGCLLTIAIFATGLVNNIMRRRRR